MPDLVPAPPGSVQTTKVGREWFMRFSSSLVNVGSGDFVVRAKHTEDRWQLEQVIPYSTSGARAVPVDSQLIFAGDTHNHWHVPRVANYHLVPFNDKGRAPFTQGRSDTKVGFCFYDYSRELRSGPEEAVYARRGCGHKSDDIIAMGLSVGWVDTYPFILPGQEISIAGLPDGRYRLWTEADEDHRFREATRSNNLTWADVELSTKQGARLARVVKVGPHSELIQGPSQVSPTH